MAAEDEKMAGSVRSLKLKASTFQAKTFKGAAKELPTLLDALEALAKLSENSETASYVPESINILKEKGIAALTAIGLEASEEQSRLEQEAEALKKTLATDDDETAKKKVESFKTSLDVFIDSLKAKYTRDKKVFAGFGAYSAEVEARRRELLERGAKLKSELEVLIESGEFVSYDRAWNEANEVVAEVANALQGIETDAESWRRIGRRSSHDLTAAIDSIARQNELPDLMEKGEKVQWEALSESKKVDRMAQHKSLWKRYDDMKVAEKRTHQIVMDALIAQRRQKQMEAFNNKLGCTLELVEGPLLEVTDIRV